MTTEKPPQVVVLCFECWEEIEDGFRDEEHQEEAVIVNAVLPDGWSRVSIHTEQWGDESVFLCPEHTARWRDRKNFSDALKRKSMLERLEDGLNLEKGPK